MSKRSVYVRNLRYAFRFPDALMLAGFLLFGLMLTIPSLKGWRDWYRYHYVADATISGIVRDSHDAGLKHFITVEFNGTNKDGSQHYVRDLEIDRDLLDTMPVPSSLLIRYSIERPDIAFIADVDGYPPLGRTGFGLIFIALTILSLWLFAVMGESFSLVVAPRPFSHTK